ncbi:hypothetical protein R3I93_017939 [Phoxinus phoxinus]|uniref:Uncharacterized protein n=1 Tax=Phoxinus phoxinus TaxID=58324 RepID=A0AAN9CIB6_9TELE
MAQKIVKNDAPSRAESHGEFSQRASLCQNLSADTQHFFKFGMNGPRPSILERPSSSHNRKVSVVIPFRRDELTKEIKHPLMPHYGLPPSVEDSSFVGPPKKKFSRDSIYKVLTLSPLCQQQTIEDMKWRAQRQRQEAARVTCMGLDCNILAYRADSQLLEVYKELDSMCRF